MNCESIGQSFAQFCSCQCCYEAILSPVIGCRGGHFVCHLCLCRLEEKTMCPSCKDNLVENQALSRFLRSAEYLLNCRFNNDGCRVQCTPDAMCKHIFQCKYRNVCCGMTEACEISSTLISVSEIKRHWFEDHEIDTGFTPFFYSFTALLDKSFDVILTKQDFLCQQLFLKQFNCENLEYMLAVHLGSESIFFWIFALDLSDGNDKINKCRINVSQYPRIGKGFEATFNNLPINSILSHQCKTIRKVLFSESTFALWGFRD